MPTVAVQEWTCQPSLPFPQQDREGELLLPDVRTDTIRAGVGERLRGCTGSLAVHAGEEL